MFTRPSAIVLAIAAVLSLSSIGCGTSEEPEKPKTQTELKGLDWSDAKSVTSGTLDSTIIRCTIDGAVTFARHDDCLIQGGTTDKI